MLFHRWTSDGILCFALLQIILWGSVIFLFHLTSLYYLPAWLVQLFLFTTFLVIWLHWCVAVSNPGFAKCSGRYCDSYCDDCGIYRWPTTHHCCRCRRCVYEFDHHCPVVANCIGRGNRKQFIMLLWVGLLTLFLAITMGIYLFHHYRETGFAVITIFMTVVAICIIYMLMEQIAFISWQVDRCTALRRGLRVSHNFSAAFRMARVRRFMGSDPRQWFF